LLIFPFWPRTAALLFFLFCAWTQMFSFLFHCQARLCMLLLPTTLFFPKVVHYLHNRCGFFLTGSPFLSLSMASCLPPGFYVKTAPVQNDFFITVLLLFFPFSLLQITLLLLVLFPSLTPASNLLSPQMSVSAGLKGCYSPFSYSFLCGLESFL